MASQFIPTLPAELDAGKLKELPAEKQHVYLFTWLSDLSKFLEYLDEDGVSAHQIFVQRELSKLVGVSTTLLPKPLRALAGRCYASVYAKGDRKTLFDTVTEVLDAINAGKADKNADSKFYLVRVVGEIFQVAGDSLLSVAAHAILSLTRLLKGSQQNAGYRSAIFTSLAQVMLVAGSFVDESLARDVWKQAKSGTTDKSSIVRVAGLAVIQSIMQATPAFNNASDFDSLRSLVVKAFEFPQANVRLAAAKCWAHALVVGSTITTSVVEIPGKKAKKPVLAGDDAASTPPPPPPSTKKIVEHQTYTFDDVLQLLSAAYTKSGATTRVRAGVVHTFMNFFLLTGPAEIEARYMSIVRVLLNDIVASGSVINNRFRKLTARRHVELLLNDTICHQLLGENGRINAAKMLTEEYLSNYPIVLKDQFKPHKYALIGAVGALRALIRSLGSYIATLQEPIRNTLLRIMQHPNYTVQLYVCSCMREFVLAYPQQLTYSISTTINNLNRELAVLKGRRVSNDTGGRCLGYANGVAAMIGITALRPHYASFDVTSRIFSLATTLLKTSGNLDLQVSTTQIQVAWTLVAGLMSMGPNFVKLHLSQLLLLWKSALPKHLSKDSVIEKSSLEYSFLLHVRECALSSIVSFLEFNRRLLSNDVAKRLIVMLQNTTSFLNLVLSKKLSEDSGMRLIPNLHLVDYELMTQRRILQCYIKLIEAGHSDTLQADLFTSTVTLFSDPDHYLASPLSTAIAAGTGAYESLWEVADNYAYGVTSLVRQFNVAKFGFERANAKSGEDLHWLTKSSYEDAVENMLSEPTVAAVEHDYVQLMLQSTAAHPADVQPKAAATAVVDSAIEVFVLLFLSKPAKIQESILEQLSSFLNAASLNRNNGRKMAITTNAVVALLGVLKLYATDKSGQLQSPAVLNLYMEILKSVLSSSDPYVRMISADTIGRLYSMGSSHFNGNQIKLFVDEIVNNRDPNTRAGLALALGQIHSHLGGMAAGFHLKTIMGILMSLSNDPHPTVHFWAIDSLVTTIESAGLSFSGYTTSTLGMLLKLYLADTHNQECPSALSSNLEVDFSTARVLTRCIDALIGVLGPDLQDSPKNREIINYMTQELTHEADDYVIVEAIKCDQHLVLFAPSFFDIGSFCQRLARYILSHRESLRRAAIDAFYQLIRNDANQVFVYAGRQLEELLWLAFDQTPYNEGLRSIIESWLTQTGVAEAELWVTRCQTVLVKIVGREATAEAAALPAGEVDLKDEEIASFANGADGDRSEFKEPMKWQTKVFALSCLRELIQMNKDSPENIVRKFGDVIKAAFSASTSHVLEIRLVGIRLLDDILQHYSHIPDPDFPETPLLEQYQAQIGSALNTTFSSDSSPELASEAINVCADFIASGVVEEAGRMGRMLRLLSSALESCAADGDDITLGDLKGLSTNSQTMLKMAILSAWAELQIASAERTYLKVIIKPHVTALASLWLAALREYSQLKFDSDAASIGGGFNPSENMGPGGTQDGVLQFYEQAWLKIADAIATLIEQDRAAVMDALDDRHKSAKAMDKTVDDYTNKNESASFFFVLFGLCFKDLVKGPSGETDDGSNVLQLLNVMRHILQPAICGRVIYKNMIFAELIDLLDRLILTESLRHQSLVVDILRNLCVSHPSSHSQVPVDSDGNEVIDEGIDQMFELLRGVVLVVSQMHPQILDDNAGTCPAPAPLTPAAKPITEEIVEVTKKAVSALSEMVDAFPLTVRTDLYASYLHIFTALMDIPSCQENVIPGILPSLRVMLRNMIKAKELTDQVGADSDSADQLVQEIRSFLAFMVTTFEDVSRARHKEAVALRKNCAICVVIVLSTWDSVLVSTDYLIPQCCSILVEALSNEDTMQVGAQCCKSVLMTASKTSFMQAVGRNLLPQLVALTTDGSDSENGVGATVCDILLAFTKTLSSDKVISGIAICVPVILYRASETNEIEAAKNQLLELAAFDSISFKNVVANLSGAQKQTLESVLRSASTQSSLAADDTHASQPSIQLKMNFSSF
ncbi:armadillo-type protein [Dipodascopsis tothii]|uniref:armadillo-type protein n=1 Tax=Dipodascopsis tothii TaxID=44089 RepID=UPI0034CEB137